ALGRARAGGGRIAAAVPDRPRSGAADRGAARPAAGAAEMAACRAQRLHHAALRHADRGAHSLHHVDVRARIRGQGDHRLPVRLLSDALQHGRRGAQHPARADRGGALLPLERDGAVVRRALSGDPALYDDGIPAGDRPCAGRHGRLRILPGGERHRRADHGELAQFRHRRPVRHHPHRHRARRAADVDRHQSRESLHRLARALPMSTQDIRVTAAARPGALAQPAVPHWRRMTQSAWFAKAVGGIAILLAWELLVRWLAPNYVAKPSNILPVFIPTLTSEAMLEQAWATLWAVIQGLAISIVAGVVLGLAMGRVKFFDRLLRIYVTGLYAMPMTAILPLLTIWLGYSSGARLATVIFASIFPIAMSVCDGARSVPHEYLEVARSYRARWHHIWLGITLASSLP